MNEIKECPDQYTEGFQAGKRTGFGIAALSLGLVTYLSLLGLEKAILTIVLGLLAMKGKPPILMARRLGIASIALGVLFIASAAVLLFFFHDRIAGIIETLKKLS